jgi:hypothetical protein
VNAANPCHISELLLRPAAFRAQLAYSSSKPDTNIDCHPLRMALGLDFPVVHPQHRHGSLAMKGFGQIAFFAFVGVFVIGIPAGIDWFTKGQWPKDLWIEVLVFFAACAVTAILEQLQDIFSVVSEIKKQGDGLQEKIEEIEASISDIDGRLLRSTRSALDEY